MSTHRGDRVDRRTAERLLDSAAAGRPVGPKPLVRLVRAATLPGRPGELAGEDRAVTAFRGAQFAPVAARRRTLKATLAKLVTVKIAALVGALAIGGVALAAGTGALPNLPHVGPASHGPSVHPTGTPPGSDRSHPRSSPSPALVGPCHAWLASVADNPGKAPDNPAFGALITAAGGRERVQQYCVELLATPSPDRGKPSVTPGNQPTATPSNESTRHPGRDPSKHPDRVQPATPGDQPTATPTSP
jgi:hypothetical protein